MKLSDIESALQVMDEVRFVEPNGNFVPVHFHVTEIGLINKHFIDCGGTIRKETRINFQLWTADDHNHRLSTDKLQSIIQLSKEQLNLVDAEVEVEYQQGTIGKFDLSFNGKEFVLVNTQTDCLAKDNCGIPADKVKVNLSELSSNSCTPGSGCC
jgi:hypothetical protein